MGDQGGGRVRHPHLDESRYEADEARQRLRLSRAALARKAGISVDTVRSFLAGNNVDDTTLSAISGALGMPVLYLVDLAKHGASGPRRDAGGDGMEVEDLLVEVLRDASEETKREVLDFARYKLRGQRRDDRN
jgi:transcriptional regulator with XRE-family HTH domain